jgi:hypothetical protein
MTYHTRYTDGNQDLDVLPPHLAPVQKGGTDQLSMRGVRARLAETERREGRWGGRKGEATHLKTVDLFLNARA